MQGPIRANTQIYRLLRGKGGRLIYECKTLGLLDKALTLTFMAACVHGVIPTIRGIAILSMKSLLTIFVSCEQSSMACLCPKSANILSDVRISKAVTSAFRGIGYRHVKPICGRYLGIRHLLYNGVIPPGLTACRGRTEGSAYGSRP